MIKSKAVIFDMDGVIIDSEGFWKQAEQEVFSALGVKITEEDAEKTRSMTTAEVTSFWHEKYPWEDKTLEEVEQMVIYRVIDLIEKEECRIDGIEIFIKKLRDRNIKIGLATNSPQMIIPVVLNKLELTDCFDVVASAELEEKGKPDPSIYLSTAQKLNVQPGQCYVIEDSNSGMLAAKRAGMKVVAFTNGSKETKAELADYQISSFETQHNEILQQLT